MEKIKFEYISYFKCSLVNFLKKKGYSDKNIYYLIYNNNIYINNIVVRDKQVILPLKKTIITVYLNDEDNTLPIKRSNIDIIYEDEYFLIVNKPYDLDIEPTKRNYTNNLASEVSYYFKTNDIKSKIHLVNRLDKQTTGQEIIAKNQYIHNLFKKVKITKKYQALVKGKVKRKGIIKIRLAKDNNSIKRKEDINGKLCISKYKLIKYENGNSLVVVLIKTGRTHQIRVSFKHINHPLVNDPLYDKALANDKMYLKAYYIRFIHPITKKRIIVTI